MVKHPPTRSEETRDDLLIRVASMYYERDYSQQKIAEILGDVSRSGISRLLKEAKEKGLVEIRVHKRFPTVPVLEDALVEIFGMESALVIDSGSANYESRLRMAGQAAAWHLEGMLRGDDTLAISWGTGVSAAVEGFGAHPELHVDVVQMIGSVGRVDSIIDGPELARRLAVKLGGRYFYLHAPLFVDSESTRNLFLQQVTIAETMDMARKAKVALVGVGSVEPGKSAFLRGGHLSEDDVADLRNQGAVGETAGQHFDIDGQMLGLDINNRVMSLQCDDLRAIPHTVAVACGLHKKRSIIGALRGGYLNVIATDDITARAIIEDVHA